jgi:phasin
MVNAPKTAAKTDEAAKDAADTVTQMRESAEKQVRAIAEKGVQQAQEGYARLKSAGEEATDALEDSFATASHRYKELGRKSVEATRVNVNAHFDFLSALIAAKSVTQAVELQSSYARQQFDVMRDQVRDLSELAKQATLESAKPLQDLASKGLRYAP